MIQKEMIFLSFGVVYEKKQKWKNSATWLAHDRQNANAEKQNWGHNPVIPFDLHPHQATGIASDWP